MSEAGRGPWDRVEGHWVSYVATPRPTIRDSSSPLRRVVESSEIVCGGDVPYRGWRGVTVSALPLCQPGTSVLLSCAWQEGMALGPTGVLAPHHGPFASLPVELLDRTWSTVRLVELLDGTWSAGPLCRVAWWDLVRSSTLQSCSVGLGRFVHLAELLGRTWSVCSPRRFAQRDLVDLDGPPWVMSLLWVPRSWVPVTFIFSF
jgi:hypothetical protein